MCPTTAKQTFSLWYQTRVVAWWQPRSSKRVVPQREQHGSLYKVHYTWYSACVIAYEEGVAKLYRNSWSLFCIRETKIKSGVIYNENPNNFQLLSNFEIIIDPAVSQTYSLCTPPGWVNLILSLWTKLMLHRNLKSCCDTNTRLAT